MKGRRTRSLLWFIPVVCAASWTTPMGVAAQLMDEQIYTFVQFDQLEYRRLPAHPVAWELLGWIGGDFNRLWIKSEGSSATEDGSGDVEVQALYSRLIAPFWEMQIGLRTDVEYGKAESNIRALAAFGFEGLAPYWFEVEPVVFVSHRGDVSARLTSTYEVFLGQRLIAQPRVEFNAAVQDVPDFGVGSGLNDVELGLRLRYEVRRKTAPYLGVNWERQIGETAELARAAGDDPDAFSVVGGVRLWF